jgi:cell division septum initiation protein DivIVA
MDQELDLLLKQTQQLMGIARKLSDENVQLRTQLEQAREAQALMQTRMDEARTRVETALARLPIETTGEG